jgi:hypothetical protein
VIITDPDRVSEILTAVVEDPSVFDMFVSSPDELAEQLDLTEEELEALRATEQLPQIFDAITTTGTQTGYASRSVTVSTSTEVSTSQDDSGQHTHTVEHVSTSTTTGSFGTGSS